MPTVTIDSTSRKYAAHTRQNIHDVLSVLRQEHPELQVTSLEERILPPTALYDKTAEEPALALTSLQDYDIVSVDTKLSMEDKAQRIATTDGRLVLVNAHKNPQKLKITPCNAGVPQKTQTINVADLDEVLRKTLGVPQKEQGGDAQKIVKTTIKKPGFVERALTAMANVFESLQARQSKSWTPEEKLSTEQHTAELHSVTPLKEKSANSVASGDASHDTATESPEHSGIDTPSTNIKDTKIEIAREKGSGKSQ
jgi:hypothetical protein